MIGKTISHYEILEKLGKGRVMISVVLGIILVTAGAAEIISK